MTRFGFGADVLVKGYRGELQSASRHQNKDHMAVTPDVSHVEMWPYVASAAVASANHAATAVLMLLSVMT